MLPLPTRMLPDLRLRLAELCGEPGRSREQVDDLVAAIDALFDECLQARWRIGPESLAAGPEGPASLLEREILALSVLRSRALALYLEPA